MLQSPHIRRMCPNPNSFTFPDTTLDRQASHHLTLYGGCIFPVQHSFWHFLPSAIDQLQLSPVFKIKAQLRPSKSRQFFFLPLNFGRPVGGLSRHFFGAPKFQGFFCVWGGGCLFSHTSGLQWAHNPPSPMVKVLGFRDSLHPYENFDNVYFPIF